MRRWLSAVLGTLIAVIVQPQYAEAADPAKGMQWDLEDPLNVQISIRGFILNNQEVHFGLIDKKGIRALQEIDLSVQYRLWENRKGDKLECYVGPSLSTHYDVPDRVETTWSCGYTLRENLRFEGGSTTHLNIGRSTPRIAYWWVSANAKLIEKPNFFLDGYLRYSFDSELSARITTSGVSDSRPLTVDSGITAKYRAGRYVYAFTSPYVFLDDSFSPARVGTYAGFQYRVGEHIGFSKNISMELAGNYGTNFSPPSQDEKQVWLRFIWELK